jgi:hypothetical protein
MFFCEVLTGGVTATDLSKNRVYSVEDLNNLGENSKLNSMALVRERTIPTERPPPVGEVSANFCG